MREIFLLKTDYGSIPIAVWISKYKNTQVFNGSFIDDIIHIQITEISKENVFLKLKIFFEKYVDNWLKTQLSEIKTF